MMQPSDSQVVSAVLEKLRDLRALHGNMFALLFFASLEPAVPPDQTIFALATLWLQRRFPGLEIGDDDGLASILEGDAEKEGVPSERLLCRYAWSQLEDKLTASARKGLN